MLGNWPRITVKIPGIRGTIKTDFADFRVEEIPAYEPSGEGTHVYVTIEKQGLTTGRAIRDIAGELSFRERDVGYAGQKDARGVTVQTLSFEHADPERIANLDLPRIKILSVSRHRNKFKVGHTKGNRFEIKMRDTDPNRFADVQKVMSVLRERGVPNYFGPQRFGNRGDTHRVGKALLGDNFSEAASTIAGNAGPDDSGRILKARQHFDRGEYELAATAWPRGFYECVKLCRALDREGANVKDAVLGLGKKSIKFYVSAYQSYLFNNFLAHRLATYDRVEKGDLAWKHLNGAAFTVADPDVEAPRAEQFEISPTGPLFGPKMTLPGAAVLALEDRVLDEEGITRDFFSKKGLLKTTGGRRPLRVRPENLLTKLGEDEDGPYILLGFALPPGSYATSVFREICKDDLQIIG